MSCGCPPPPNAPHSLQCTMQTPHLPSTTWHRSATAQAPSPHPPLQHHASPKHTLQTICFHSSTFSPHHIMGVLMFPVAPMHRCTTPHRAPEHVDMIHGAIPLHGERLLLHCTGADAVQGPQIPISPPTIGFLSLASHIAPLYSQSWVQVAEARESGTTAAAAKES